MTKYIIPLFALGVLALATYSADDPKPVPEADVAKLIVQLGSADFATREDAARRLARMPTAAPALREAKETSDDPEVRSRAAAALKSLTAFQAVERKAEVVKLLDEFASGDTGKRDAAVKQLTRTRGVLPLLREVAEQPKDKVASARAADAIKALCALRARDLKRWNEEAAKNRDLGRLIELAVCWRESVSKEDLERLRAVAFEVRERLGKHCDDDIPSGEFPAVVKPGLEVGLVVGKTLPLSNDKTKLGTDVIAEYLTGTRGGLTVSRDGAQLSGGGGRYGIYGGSVSFDPPTLIPVGGLLIVNGDLKGNKVTQFKEAVIICTGHVQVDFFALDTVIVAGGEITAPGKRHTWLYPKEKALADWVKWCDGASNGMTVEVKDKQLLVGKVDAGKPFAKAGLQSGDRIARVNGESVSDLRSLNKFLYRASIAPDGTAEIDVRRNGKLLTLTVQFAD